LSVEEGIEKLPRSPSVAVTMFVLVRAVTYLRFLLGSCWFICPVDSYRGRALLRPQIPERRMSRE
jgi:hypothetical protein